MTEGGDETPSTAPAETTQAGAGPQSPLGAKPRETLSQFIARILDQLSISAWLPAAALIFIALLYGNLVANDGDLGLTLNSISSMSIGAALLLLGLLIVVTMIVQAFEFDAIRLLEGYWSLGWASRRLGDVGCRRHHRKLESLERRKQDIDEIAFCRARQRMLRSEISPAVVAIVEGKHLGIDAGEPGTPDQLVAESIDWRDFARPQDMRHLAAIDASIERYPTVDRRILPTKLGNVLRAHEDKVYDIKEGRLEGLVLRIFHELPTTLQVEHDQYRGRLDLYCSLCVVLALATVSAGPTLGSLGWREPVIATAVSLLLYFLSYRAAVTSAMRYGSILLTIREFKRGATEQLPALEH